jgi:hypothetical protein
VLTGEAVPGSLAALDLDAFTPRQWKQLRAELMTSLQSGRDGIWEEAAQQAIFLSFYYRDKVNLDRAARPLLDTYILDRDEQHRILALAALHALGHHDAMAHLAQRVRLEGSPRVRRLTVAALADHYGIRDYYGRSQPRVLIGPYERVAEQQPDTLKGQ